MAASVGDPMSQYQLLSGKTVLVIGASYMTTDRRFIWKTFQDLKAKVRFCNSCEPMFIVEDSSLVMSVSLCEQICSYVMLTETAVIV